MSWLGMDNGDWQTWRDSGTRCEYCGARVMLEYGQATCENPDCPGADCDNIHENLDLDGAIERDPELRAYFGKHKRMSED